MIFSAAQRKGVDPGTMLALFQWESHFGTAGLATKTKNPGNVGGDTPDSRWYKPDWQSGVDLTADWLAQHKSGTGGTQVAQMVQAPASMSDAGQRLVPVSIPTPATASSITSYLGTPSSPMIIPPPPFGLSAEGYNKSLEDARNAIALPYDLAGKTASTAYAIAQTAQMPVDIAHKQTEIARLGRAAPGEITQEVDLGVYGMPGIRVQLNSAKVADLAHTMAQLDMNRTYHNILAEQHKAAGSVAAMKAELEKAQVADVQKEDALTQAMSAVPIPIGEKKDNGQPVTWGDLSRTEARELRRVIAHTQAQLATQQAIDTRQRQAQVYKSIVDTHKAFGDVLSSEFATLNAIRKQIKDANPKMPPAQVEEAAYDRAMSTLTTPNWKQILYPTSGVPVQTGVPTSAPTVPTYSQTATNPTTGQKRGLNANGKWEVIQ